MFFHQDLRPAVSKSLLENISLRHHRINEVFSSQSSSHHHHYEYLNNKNTNTKPPRTVMSPFRIFVLIITALFALLAISVTNAMQIEFKRSSYSDSTSSYYTLYARVSTVWQRVCYGMNLGSTDASALCAMMGYSTSRAAMSYSSSTSSYSGIGGLSCNTQSGNSTNFNQCSYTSSYTSCRSGSYYQTATLRCGAMLSDGGSRGIYVDGSSSTDYFIRRRWNNQLQARQIFSTTWKNVAASTATSFDYNAVSNLCYWSTGNSMYSSWGYVSSASPVLDSANGFAFKDVTCKSTSTSSSYSLSSCSYSTSSLSSVDSSSAVALTCSVSTNDKGVSIGSGKYLSLSGSSTYKTIQIYDSTAYPSYVYKQQICTSSTSSSSILDTNTRAAFCRWAGYGSNAYGYTSTTYASTGVSAIWKSVTCPAGATSISQCTVNKASTGELCYRTITLRCYQSSSSPYSPSSSKNKHGSTGSFPIVSIIVPVVWIVIVIGFFMYRRSRIQSMATTTSSYNASNNMQVMGSTSSSTSNNNYQNFNHSPSSPPMMMAGQQNNIQFAPTMGSPVNGPGQNYQPDQNFNGNMPPPPPANFAGGPPGMTTFDNVYQGGQGDNVPPPPGGYSFMPGFDPNQGGGNYPPPPPHGGY